MKNLLQEKENKLLNIKLATEPWKKPVQLRKPELDLHYYVINPPLPALWHFVLVKLVEKEALPPASMDILPSLRGISHFLISQDVHTIQTREALKWVIYTMCLFESLLSTLTRLLNWVVTLNFQKNFHCKIKGFMTRAISLAALRSTCNLFKRKCWHQSTVQKSGSRKEGASHQTSPELSVYLALKGDWLALLKVRASTAPSLSLPEHSRFSRTDRLPRGWKDVRAHAILCITTLGTWGRAVESFLCFC